MASGASEVSICNLALSHIGETAITALSDNTKAARECNRLYTVTRDMELRAHNWNFAIQQGNLAEDGTTPDGDSSRTHRYELPATCLRIVEVYNTNDWRIEGGNTGETGKRFLVCDLSGPVYIRFVARVTDPAVFDMLFVNVLAARLAMDLSVPLSQSSTVREGAERAYRHATMQAKAFDAIESGPRSFPEVSWLSARE